MSGGFTLLEVLVALAVVSIGLTAAVHSTIGGQREYAMAADRDEATLAAVAKMQQLEAGGEAYWQDSSGTLDHGLKWILSARQAGLDGLKRLYLLRLRVEREAGGYIVLEQVVGW